MIYKGYKVRETDSGVVAENIRDFDPVHTFECGQCFRWNREADGSYTGVAHGRVLNVAHDGRDLYLNNTSLEDFQNIWYEYFDLGTDYDRIKSAVAKDDIMNKAVEFGHGIRLLRQELPEVLISFIISTNNNIPRIKKIVEALSRQFGNEIEYKGKPYYSFPDMSCLSCAGIDEIAVCRGGYRTNYIYNTTRFFEADKPCREYLKSMGTEDARKYLLKLSGVGPKVADCVLLYAGIKFDVFPTDVWVRRVMGHLYLNRSAGLKEISSFASSYFGEFAGYAQQYLFYFARENAT